MTEAVKVKCLTSDNKQFEVDFDILKRSVVISNMIEDIGELEQAIPLPNVTGRVFEKVIEWCNIHRKDPPPPPVEDEYNRPTVEMKPIDNTFFKDFTDEEVFEIILAANYLDIKQLLDVSCKWVANIFPNKTAEELRQRFNIVNDFTPEEIEQIKLENAWAEER